MPATTAENVHNLFEKDEALDTNPQPTTSASASPPNQSNSVFPNVPFKINNAIIYQNADISKGKGNTPEAQDEAMQATLSFHLQSFQSILQDTSKELVAEKSYSETKSNQLDIEINSREKDEAKIPKEIDEKRHIATEVWSKKDRITLSTCIITGLAMFLWVFVTWSHYLHKELLWSWGEAIFFPIVIPALSLICSLCAKHFLHASHPTLLRNMTLGAGIIASVCFILMLVFIGIETSMTRDSVAGGILAEGGGTVPMWVSLIRIVSQGILEFMADFIIIAIISDILDKISINRYEIIQVPNFRYLDHVAITEGLRTQKSALDQRISEITDWFEAQQKTLQATLSEGATRLKEKLI